MSEHRKERYARYDFTEAEKEQMRQEIPPICVQMNGIDGEIEVLKGQIKGKKTTISFLDGKIKAISKLIEDGFELRPTPCIRFKSYKAKYWIFINEETGAEVCRESFNIGDDQRGIGELIWPPDEDKTLDEVLAEIRNPGGKTHFEEFQEEMNRKGLNVTVVSKGEFEEGKSSKKKNPKE